MVVNKKLGRGLSSLLGNKDISKINNIVEPMFSFWSLKIYKNLENVLLNNDGYKKYKFSEILPFDFKF